MYFNIILFQINIEFYYFDVFENKILQKMLNKCILNKNE